MSGLFYMYFEVLKFASNEQLYAKQKFISLENVSLQRVGLK